MKDRAAPAGLRDMILTAAQRWDGWYVVVNCRICGRGVCMYSVTDLDELSAEYGAHITGQHRTATRAEAEAAAR